MITMETVAHAGRRRARVVFGYDEAAPFEVRMTFPDSLHDGEPVTWFVARDVLNIGCRRKSGDGDVQVWPFDLDQLAIRLIGPEASNDLLVPRLQVQRFLHRTCRLVPLGTERADVDSWLDELLKEA